MTILFFLLMKRFTFLFTTSSILQMYTHQSACVVYAIDSKNSDREK